MDERLPRKQVDKPEDTVDNDNHACARQLPYEYYTLVHQSIVLVPR